MTRRLLVTAFLLAVAVAFLSADNADLAGELTYYLCYDEMSGCNLRTSRFDGDVEVAFDPSVGLSTKLAVLALLPRINELIAPTARLSTEPSPTRITIYIGSEGRSELALRGVVFKDQTAGYAHIATSTTGHSQWAAVWLANDTAIGDTRNDFGHTANHATLVQELTQSLGPTADGLGGNWTHASPTPWLSKLEELVLMTLYKKLQGGEDAVTTYRNVLAILNSISK